MRSVSETVNSMLKRRLPSKIRERKPERKGAEKYLKVNVHNSRQYCYLTYINARILKEQKRLSAN